MNPIPECIECGGKLQPISERMEIRIGQRAVTIEAEKLQCLACGTRLFAAGQMAAAQAKASEEIRRQEGLLLPNDIRALRDRYDLTQSGLETLIGSGPKTAVRWESGAVFQSQTADALLRVLAGVPAAAEFLASLRGVTLGNLAPPSVPECPESRAEVADDKIIPMDRPRRAPRSARSAAGNARRRPEPVPAPVLPEEQLG
jgi:putative zinc finger/helix-turn-helix YgiT family protein